MARPTRKSPEDSIVKIEIQWDATGTTYGDTEETFREVVETLKALREKGTLPSFHAVTYRGPLHRGYWD